MADIIYPDLTQPLKLNGINSKLIVNSVLFSGNGNPTPLTAFAEGDPKVCAAESLLFAKCGVSVDCALWAGPGTYTDRPVLEHWIQARENGLKFALMFDNNLAGSKDQATATKNVIAALQTNFIWAILGSPQYMEGNVVFEFDSGADMTAVAAAFPDVKFWSHNLDYGWPGPASMADGSFAKVLLNPRMQCPGIIPQFFDGSPASIPPYSQSYWGGAARMLEAQGGYTLWDQVDAIKAAGKQFPYVITPMDRNERTDGWINAACWFTGTRLRG